MELSWGRRTDLYVGAGEAQLGQQHLQRGAAALLPHHVELVHHHLGPQRAGETVWWCEPCDCLSNMNLIITGITD